MLSSGRRPGSLMRAAAVLTAITLPVCAGCTTESPDGATPSGTGSVITSTTLIAGAGVLGNQRRPDESCAGEPARADPGPSMRRVTNAAGVSPEHAEVPADPQRIVALAGDQLDALCALGLQPRLVAAALPDGAAAQPSYLGTVVHELPGVGSREAPDLAAIAALNPDLILGSPALTPQLYPQLAEIAPTVFTAAAGADWQDNLRAVGAATGRGRGADALLDDFGVRAARLAAEHDTVHHQASIVQLTEGTVRVYGAANFPASVLTAAGVDRPAAQRFTDQPFIEIGASADDLDDAADFSAADADIVYVSFTSAAAKDHAPAVFDSDAWRALSATRDNRVFVVNNEVWQSGRGLIAARGILADLRWVDAPIN